LQRLTRGADPNAVGDAFMLPKEFADVSREDIVGSFGSMFADAVTAATPDTWAGPVRSPYGVHLVKLESHTPRRAARFEEVRDLVRQAYVAQEQRQANSAMRAKLRQQYRIVIETAAGSGS
jgi:parvulin-like peptidyl-prolyl isomerase